MDYWDSVATAVGLSVGLIGVGVVCLVAVVVGALVVRAFLRSWR